MKSLQMHILLAASAVILSLLASTVGAADKDTGTVEGKVTFKGKPLDKGKIAFHPEKGKPVTADIQKDGTYTAKNVPVGELRISIEAKGLPKDYADPKKSALRLEIKKGMNNCDFDLDE
jgi:hypothetical protein